MNNNISKALLLGAAAALLILFAGCAQQGQGDRATQADFVGSERCRSCHAREYQGWLETIHSQGIQDVNENPNAVVGDFESESDTRTFSLDRVAYTFGLQWKQRYLTRQGDDFLILPAQFNLATDEWVPYEAEEWRERRFSALCSGCHATGVTSSNRLGVEMNVGCEACHGPGESHANAEGRESPKTIVNPARLPADLGAMVCGRCHSRGRDTRDDLPFAVNYQAGAYLPRTFNIIETTDTEHFFPGEVSQSHHLHYIDWRNSAHAQHGVTCMDCHTVHSKGTNNKFQTKLPGSTLCRSCHEMNQAIRAHSLHSFGDCVGCHMPLTAKSAVPADIHNHTFKIVPPSQTVNAPTVNNSCNGCHRNIPAATLQQALQGVSRVGATPFESKLPEVGGR